MIQPGLERLKYSWSILPKWTLLMWLLVIVLAVFLFLTFGLHCPPELLLTFVGALVATIFQTAAACRANVSHFLECFSRCNESYAKLNERLRPPSSQGQNGKHLAADDGPNDAIIDYFNLCAEEYLMHKMGVIPGFVWKVWRAGIHERVRKDHLKLAWDAEVKAARDEGMKVKCLYYGFDLKKIIQEHHVSHWRKCKNRGNCPLGQVTARASHATAAREGNEPAG